MTHPDSLHTAGTQRNIVIKKKKESKKTIRYEGKGASLTHTWTHTAANGEREIGEHTLVFMSPGI